MTEPQIKAPQTPPPSEHAYPPPSPPSSPPSHPSPPPADPAPPDNRITLRVRDDNDNEYAFMMKRTTPFKRIFDAFAQKVKQRVRMFRFHFEGLRLAEEDTPQRVGLKDDDLIEAFVLAEGG